MASDKRTKKGVEGNGPRLRVRKTTPTTCRALDTETYETLLPYLTVRYTQFVAGASRYGAGKHIQQQRKMIQRNGIFLAGLLPRVMKEFPQIELEDWAPGEVDVPIRVPNLPGYDPKEYQGRAVEKALDIKRGVIVSPARSGKTVIAAFIINSFVPPINWLFVTHKKDLLYQFKELFEEVGFKFGIVGDGHKDLQEHTIGMVQSLSRMTKQIKDKFQVVIVDECHHANTLTGNYAKVLKAVQASYIFGLTATPPSDPIKAITMEALIGPVIEEIFEDETQEDDMTVPPKVIFKRIPDATSIKNIKTWRDAYKYGVILNRARNRIIIKTAKEYLEQDMTVLILVNRVRHGFFLQGIAEKILPQYEIPFLCGDIDAEARKEIKELKGQIEREPKSTVKTPGGIEALQKELDELLAIRQKISENNKRRYEFRKKLDRREIRCVIATNIWNEGVNIPSLNVLINAAGGKSEIATIQASSRSLTASEGKAEGLVIDFFDPNHRTFIDHFGERMCIYCDRGWIK